MGNTETSSVQLTTRARAISVGMGFGGLFAEYASKIAQTIGLPLGANLSESDRNAINTFYQTRADIQEIVPVQGGVIQAANDEKFGVHTSTKTSANDQNFPKAA